MNKSYSIRLYLFRHIYYQWFILLSCMYFLCSFICFSVHKVCYVLFQGQNIKSLLIFVCITQIDYIKNNNLSYQYKINNIKLKLTISINLHVSQFIIFMYPGTKYIHWLPLLHGNNLHNIIKYKIIFIRINANINVDNFYILQ